MHGENHISLPPVIHNICALKKVKKDVNCCLLLVEGLGKSNTRHGIPNYIAKNSINIVSKL